MTSEKRGLLVGVVILLLTWVVAGVVNANGFLMGGTPTTVGVLATVVTVCAWPVVGWFAGTESWAGFVRFSTVFWITVLAGTSLVFWALTTAPGRTVSQGGIVLPLLLFALVAPLYGLVAMLPYQAAPVWAAGIGAAVLVMTLGAYLAGRCRGRRSARVDSV